MITVQATTQESKSGPTYDGILAFMHMQFGDLGKVPLFTTDVNPDRLWEEYLAGFTAEERQFHNCNACRHFIQRFGALVTLNRFGSTNPAVFTAELAEFAKGTPYWLSLRSMTRIVECAKVTGVFLHSDPVLGTPNTGEWTHFSIRQHKWFTSKVKTAYQAMAEKAEDHKNVLRALQEFPPQLVAQALQLLKSDALYRSEKVLGQAQFLADLHEACVHGNRSNQVWRAVATAPEGFCHPRASMIGTMLEDLEKGMGFDAAARRFKDKMNPLQYQRPQAAPSSQTVAQAEKLVEQMGIELSLERRFARLDEIQTVWKPAAQEPAKSGGVFAGLVTKEARKSEPSKLTVGRTSITWSKFSAQVLPDAVSIELMAPSIGNYCAYVTATHADAPPVLQWDTEEQRNPVSQYVKAHGGYARNWGVQPDSWVKVTGVSLHPSKWFGTFDHHQNSVLFVLESCVDNDNGGLALFPETLKSELHAVRSVIEAHSLRGRLTGKEDASACGVKFMNDSPVLVRVTAKLNITTEYTIDRWD